MIASYAIATVPISYSTIVSEADITTGSIEISIDSVVAFTDRKQLDLSLDTVTSFDGIYIEQITGSFALTQDTACDLSVISGSLGSINLNQSTDLNLSGSIAVFGSFVLQQETALELSQQTTGTLQISLDTECSLSGFENILGNLILDVLSDMSFSGYGSTDLGDTTVEADVICMNTKTLGVSEYSNYNFNSFFNIGQRYFGCNDNGVFELTGNLDGTLPVAESVIRSGASDFGEQKLKSMSDCYIYVRSSGDSVFRLIADEQSDRAGYSAYYDGKDGMHRRRIKVAKGIRGTTWQVEFKNDSGSDFALKQIDTIPITLDRSI